MIWKILFPPMFPAFSEEERMRRKRKVWLLTVAAILLHVAYFLPDLLGMHLGGR